ncbi:PAR-6 protein [Aphelenchoides avenae]|nr:PAR-6 protein [Aphelenchus avenae]
MWFREFRLPRAQTTADADVASGKFTWPLPKGYKRLQIKSKFDSEFRRFSIPLNPDRPMSYAEFKNFVETVHSLHNIPFTLCYTSISGDLLPITNDEVGVFGLTN